MGRGRIGGLVFLHLGVEGSHHDPGAEQDRDLPVVVRHPDLQLAVLHEDALSREDGLDVETFEAAGRNPDGFNPFDADPERPVLGPGVRVQRVVPAPRQAARQRQAVVRRR